MTETESQEPAAPSDPGPVEPAKGRQSFSKLRRELSDDELTSPAVQRMLLDDVDRLEREASELRAMRDKYHDADKRCAVLDEQRRGANSAEIQYGMCLTLGSVALGFAPTLWPHQPAGWVSVLFGIALVGGGVVSKVVKK